MNYAMLSQKYSHKPIDGRITETHKNVAYVEVSPRSGLKAVHRHGAVYHVYVTCDPRKCTCRRNVWKAYFQIQRCEGARIAFSTRKRNENGLQKESEKNPLLHELNIAWRNKTVSKWLSTKKLPKLLLRPIPIYSSKQRDEPIRISSNYV